MGDPRRRARSPTRATMAIDGRPYAPQQPARGAPRRRRDDPPGAVARAAPSVMENILLGVEPTRYGFPPTGRGCAAIATPRPRRARARRHSAPTRSSARCPSPVQQIVEIARAIAVGCRVLVLDEPTSSLGREDVRQLFAMLGRLQARATRSSTSRISSKRSPRSPIASSSCGTAGTPAKGRPPARRTMRIVAMMVGGSARAICSRGRPRVAASRSSTVDALEPGDATFTLHRGEVFGIAGLIGAGPHAPAAHAVRARAGAPRARHARRLQRRRRRRTSAGSRAWAC